MLKGVITFRQLPRNCKMSLHAESGGRATNDIQMSTLCIDNALAANLIREVSLRIAYELIREFFTLLHNLQRLCSHYMVYDLISNITPLFYVLSDVP